MSFVRTSFALTLGLFCLPELGLSYDGKSNGSVYQVPTYALAQATSDLERLTLNRTQITHYPYFRGACSAFVVGYSDTTPLWGNFKGNCEGNKKPMLFTVTHENTKNNHKGSANYDPHIVTYIGDLNVSDDLGRWVNSAFYPEDDTSVLRMLLDTVNYQQLNVTGWPLQFGHLFFGANDLSVNSTLDKPIYVDFDIRVLRDVVRPALYTTGYSGHRILLGAKGTWDEAEPRINKSHFLEIDLVQTEGYSASYGDVDRPRCKDTIYDRCFYSANGQYAEGRELSYETYLKNPPIPTNTNQWVHVHIPISKIYQELGWVSPAKSWSSAYLSGLYIGLESEGATQSLIEVRNYQIYTE